MCGLCIAGFCIPWSAVLPMLLIVLQWFAVQLSKVGMELPKFITKRLEETTSDDDDDNNKSWCDKVWCLCKKPRRRKAIDRDGSKASSVQTPKGASSASIDNESNVEVPTKTESVLIADSNPQDASDEPPLQLLHPRPSAKQFAGSKKVTSSTTIAGAPPAAEWWCQPCA
mmetsp:Transcript_3292/g.7276  ORF Transcript_3292/g.7276 Transcript_3292/m.7276 type:complete len:170 (+) Transcript_3292:199-708(+)|eukprot:CAMPEP_0183736442 /NCGR_PEP_ID=MMETSP0737-20130205/49285_1 /TAXON_ID=385413 /ORGANISM="Thalassiosira miniscula, Strain CCMP1093" /LENGTH=169 /DNA_ID=CAMNT_0025970449 /DNA_START=75 /DNA_END=584 /DNA_ORIENTATION=-